MCGRFAITLPVDAMARLFDAAPDNDLPVPPDYNVCPTRPVHAVRAGPSGRRLSALRWGFVPQWYKTPADGPLLINARAETIAEKPAFRMAARARRCLIPATGFYEWTKDKAGQRLPWFIFRADGEPLVMAGVWQDWTGADGTHLATCAIVTTAANPSLAAVHHRMPVILGPADWPLWLGEAGKGAARIMRAAPDDALVWHRVGTDVNSSRATGPDLIVPLVA